MDPKIKWFVIAYVAFGLFLAIKDMGIPKDLNMLKQLLLEILKAPLRLGIEKLKGVNI